MNRDEILKMAQEAGAFWELSETPEKDLAFLQRFAALATAAERERAVGVIRAMKDDIEASLQKAYMGGIEAERDRCILILERLHERSGGQHNQYLYAAKVLKGEV
jgi:hypothetical protein